MLGCSGRRVGMGFLLFRASVSGAEVKELPPSLESSLDRSFLGL